MREDVAEDVLLADAAHLAAGKESSVADAKVHEHPRVGPVQNLLDLPVGVLEVGPRVMRRDLGGDAVPHRRDLRSAPPQSKTFPPYPN